jgi:hypothetical protein
VAGSVTWSGIYQTNTRRCEASSRSSTQREPVVKSVLCTAEVVAKSKVHGGNSYGGNRTLSSKTNGTHRHEYNSCRNRLREIRISSAKGPSLSSSTAICRLPLRIPTKTKHWKDASTQVIRMESFDPHECCLLLRGFSKAGTIDPVSLISYPAYEKAYRRSLLTPLFLVLSRSIPLGKASACLLSQPPETSKEPECRFSARGCQRLGLLAYWLTGCESCAFFS